MLTGGFFESAELADGTLDRGYTAQQFADYFANFISNGVFGNPANQLKVVANPGAMTVTVRAGNAYCKGYWLKLDEDLILPIANAAGNLSRIDSVVAQINFDDRVPKLYVKQGTFNVSPTAPGITRNENIYELCLAQILIGPAVLGLTDAAITDTRPNNALCGFVVGLVDQINTTELFKQYESTFRNFYNNGTNEFNQWTTQKKIDYNNWVNGQQADFTKWTSDKKVEYDQLIARKESDFDQWTGEKKQEYTDFVDDTTTEYDQYTNWKKQVFEDWFTSLKVQLEGDVATNLQNQINDIAERQKLLDIKYLEDEKTLYLPLGEATVINKTLYL